MNKLEKLIKLALKDGIVSDKERELILKQASKLGIDEIEAEMVLEGMISDHDNGIKNENSVKRTDFTLNIIFDYFFEN